MICPQCGESMPAVTEQLENGFCPDCQVFGWVIETGRTVDPNGRVVPLETEGSSSSGQSQGKERK